MKIGGKSRKQKVVIVPVPAIFSLVARGGNSESRCSISSTLRPASSRPSWPVPPPIVIDDEGATADVMKGEPGPNASIRASWKVVKSSSLRNFSNLNFIPGNDNNNFRRGETGDRRTLKFVSKCVEKAESSVFLGPPRGRNVSSCSRAAFCVKRLTRRVLFPR